jgi:hypothetical protein
MDPMSITTADTRTPKLSVTEGDTRFMRPELDFAAVEEPLLNRPPVLRDSRGENL